MEKVMPSSSLWWAATVVAGLLVYLGVLMVIVSRFRAVNAITNSVMAKLREKPPDRHATRRDAAREQGLLCKLDGARDDLDPADPKNRRTFVESRQDA